MIRTIIFLGLIFGLISCIQTKYYVKSESDLSQVDWNNNILNYIPLTDNDFKNSIILDTTYKLLYFKKYSKLNDFLNSVQSNSNDLYLAKTLYHISKKKYQDAANNLRMINETHYILLKELLFIDLSYELAKLNGLHDFKKNLQDYQTLIDKYPDHESLKNIVALRIRYIRYNY